MAHNIHLHGHPNQPQYVHYSGPSGAPSSSSLIPPPSTSHGHSYPFANSSNASGGNEGATGAATMNGSSSSSLNGAVMMSYAAPSMDQQQQPYSPQVQQQQQVQQSPSAVHASPGVPSLTGVPTTAIGSGSTSGGIIASGDWTKNLVQLAKQAELKKHALTLQLHTAHILSAHATLDAKSKAIQDVREQKNKLDSERARLLKCLQDVNADRDKADLAEATLTHECTNLRSKITQLSEGEYAIAKGDVDRLRSELGEEPLPSLEKILEDRSAQYLTDRRLNVSSSDDTSVGHKRVADGHAGPEMKRPRGRPKGSKNKSVSGKSIG